jgi:hypothetical protein
MEGYLGETMTVILTLFPRPPSAGRLIRFPEEKTLNCTSFGWRACLPIFFALEV